MRFFILREYLTYYNSFLLLIFFSCFYIWLIQPRYLFINTRSILTSSPNPTKHISNNKIHTSSSFSSPVIFAKHTIHHINSSFIEAVCESVASHRNAHKLINTHSIIMCRLRPSWNVLDHFVYLYINIFGALSGPATNER